MERVRHGMEWRHGQWVEIQPMTNHRSDGMKAIRVIVSAFTMKREEFSFTDVVSGEPVYNWRDGYGTRWMAGYWYLPGCFRVKRRNQEAADD